MFIHSPYYREFIEKLNENKVEYLLVGGYAVNVYGYARFTNDLDLWINPEKNNREKLIAVIEQTGFDTSKIRNVEFNETTPPIKLFDGKNKIEILHHLQGGFSFKEAFALAKKIEMKDFYIYVIGYHELLKNKESSMRMKDAVDAHYLKKIQEEKNGRDKDKDDLKNLP